VNGFCVWPCSSGWLLVYTECVLVVTRVLLGGCYCVLLAVMML